MPSVPVPLSRRSLACLHLGDATSAGLPTSISSLGWTLTSALGCSNEIDACGLLVTFHGKAVMPSPLSRGSCACLHLGESHVGRIAHVDFSILVDTHKRLGVLKRVWHSCESRIPGCLSTFFMHSHPKEYRVRTARNLPRKRAHAGIF